jgi:hypothetical protein
MRSLLTTLGWCCWLSLSGCFDPLFEDRWALEPFEQRYAVCCPQGMVDTCACAANQSCEFVFLPCAAGTCDTLTSSWDTLSCSSQSYPDAGMIGEDAGIADAGFPSEGDAGMADAGSPDAGSFDAGQIDAGSAPDAGRPIVGYASCCQNGRVSTCACFVSPCQSPPFTPCAGGSCLEGTTGGRCP